MNDAPDTPPPLDYERPRRVRSATWGYVFAFAGAILSTMFLLALVGLLFYGCTHSPR